MRVREAYPPARRGVSDKVWKAWKELEIDESDAAVDKMIKGLKAWTTSHDWQKEGGKYIMGMERFLVDKLWLSQPSGSRHHNINDDEKWKDAHLASGMTLGEIGRTKKEMEETGESLEEILRRKQLGVFDKSSTFFRGRNRQQPTREPATS